MRCVVARLAAASAVLALCACSWGTEARSPSGSRPSSEPSEITTATPAYEATIERIGPELQERMRFSHRPGCPVPLEDLRHLRMSYVGFDGAVHTGELVVHEDHATAVTGVFETLFEERWPIQRMRLVDEYAGDDDRSMAANNTSGYNCRRVGGTDRWSEHASGAAIDVNPLQNPFVTGSSVAPPAGRRFAAVDRSGGVPVPVGVVTADDVVVNAFASIGWGWGGDWTSAKDYQHFSASGT